MTNIVLTGPMGVGKTTVGALAAGKLGRRFADTDRMVEDAAGRSVSEIFAADGEARFRELESEAILKLSGEDGLVITVGGGAVLDPGNMRRLRSNGTVITLEAPTDVILERLEHMEDRPLLGKGGERRRGLENYLRVRAPYYVNADFKIDTGSLTPDRVAERVCDIARLPVIRICGCIAGRNAVEDIRKAVGGGVSMVELRLDLIPDTDIGNLVRGCPVPVIATDRPEPGNLEKAILAGCEFVDVDIDSAEKGALIELAKEKGCKVIVSMHDPEGVPDALPEKGRADFLKIAATLNSPDDVKKLVSLHDRRDDVIIAGMGPLGGLLRVFGPMLGSYLTYCSVGEPTATGQLDLQTMNDIYRGMGLR